MADLLGESALPAIAHLCARSLDDAPTEDELARALFAPDQPAVVQGDPDRGVVVSVANDGAGFVRLVVVDPAHRRQGRGRALLAAAEERSRAQGLRSLQVGADAPYHLWPGVATTELGLLCLLERARYDRVETNFNMEVDVGTVPADPGGWDAATRADRADVAAWSERFWPNWGAELLRAIEQGTLVVTRDAAGIAGVCAYDVNRAGLVGPVAVRHDLLGRGAGTVALLGALHRMRAAGASRVEIAWVGPIAPYARVGATIGRIFFVYRKRLA